MHAADLEACEAPHRPESLTIQCAHIHPQAVAKHAEGSCINGGEQQACAKHRQALAGTDRGVSVLQSLHPYIFFRPGCEAGPCLLLGSCMTEHQSSVMLCDAVMRSMVSHIQTCHGNTDCPLHSQTLPQTTCVLVWTSLMPASQHLIVYHRGVEPQ